MSFYPTEHRKGIQGELDFGGILTKTFGGTVEKTLKSVDMFDHIDLLWTHNFDGKKNPVGFDVKSASKAKRSDPESTRGTVAFVEILNRSGNIGSLRGKSDYMAYEGKDEWYVINRRSLLNYLLTAYPYSEEKIRVVGSKDRYNYFEWSRRYGNKDAIMLLPISFLKEKSSMIIPKNS